MYLKSLYTLLICCFGIIPLSVYSQDTIYKTDGSKLIAKITEINVNSVKYKIIDNNVETFMETKKSAIATISYSNGVKEIYNSASSVSNLGYTRQIATTNTTFIAIIFFPYNFDSSSVVLGLHSSNCYNKYY